MNLIGVSYLAISVLLFYLLVTTWPVLKIKGDVRTFKDINIFGMWCSWAPDRQMMFTVMMAGALGSFTHIWT